MNTKGPFTVKPVGCIRKSNTMKALTKVSLCSISIALTGCVVINIGHENPPQEVRLDSKPATQVRGRPQALNMDFGVWRPEPSKQVGPAAVGRRDDYWNTVGVPNNNRHTESDLKFADGSACPVQVEMINLGGGWGCGGAMGVKAPMLDTYNYRMNNQGGNSQVILHDVAPGNYQLYIYGHGNVASYYGDYTVSVGNRNYGRKATSHGTDAIENTRWVEGSQYVKFQGVKVSPGDDVEILIRPGAPVTDNSGRTFADAMICGLQLVPVR